MRKLAVSILCILAACTPSPEHPQNFEDLLKITDSTNAQICTLPLTELRNNLSPEALDAAKAEAFNFEPIIEDYADDPVAQIRILFRRSALKRRLNVDNHNPDLANEFYEDLSSSKVSPTSLKDFHDGYHYWMDRIAEQSQYGGQDTPEYNLRFCVMNEKRADLHAVSREDILSRVANGIKLPAPELIENINHETSFENGFSSMMLAEIFTDENVRGLTPLERAQMRGREPFLPSDPKIAELFWEERGKEISAMQEFIQSHDYSTPADKLDDMTDIDQSLRKLWSENEAKAHFNDADQYEVFRESIGGRFAEIDGFNTAELQKMLKGRGWFRDDLDGQGAANDAWLIAQHADRNPEFQQEALTLIEAELGAPGVSKANYAYLYDRVQIRYNDGLDGIKKLQRYATQGRCSGPETWEPFPFEAPDKIDDTRAEVGLGTLAEYKKAFKNMCTEDQR